MYEQRINKTITISTEKEIAFKGRGNNVDWKVWKRRDERWKKNDKII